MKKIVKIAFLVMVVSFWSCNEKKAESTQQNPVDECSENENLCDDLCVDLATDADHCGECGNECDSDEICAVGECIPEL